MSDKSTAVALAMSYLPLSTLKAYAKNARTHSRKQIGQVAEPIRTFGFNVPILVDEDLTVLAGHARMEAARKLGLERVPCVRLSHMTKAQKKAFILADNRLALNAGWDEELLSFELKDLVSLDKDFEMGIMGFSTSEIDGLLEGVSLEEPGDLWLLGPHRLLCGSALSAEDCARLMSGSLAQMVITDPPYTVPIAGHVSGLGKTRHREFAAASGEMSPAEFTAFRETSFRNLAGSSTDGSIHMIFMDWCHMAEVQQAGSRVYAELKNLIVWVKDNGGMGSFYRSRHELIFAFKNGTAAHVNSFELGQHGRYRTNVWTHKGMNSFGGKRREELDPTVKPVTLLVDAIKDVSTHGSIDLDLFGGSPVTALISPATTLTATGKSRPQSGPVLRKFSHSASACHSSVTICSAPNLFFGIGFLPSRLSSLNSPGSENAGQVNASGTQASTSS